MNKTKVHSYLWVNEGHGLVRIEGLHDVVSTHMPMIFPSRLVPFCMVWYREKTKQTTKLNKTT